MNRLWPRNSLGGLFATLLMLATACAPAPAVPAPTPTAAAERVSLKVANLPFIAYAPFQLGVEDGLFAQQGLDVELVNFAAQADAQAALVAGQVDVMSGQVSAGLLNVMARGAQASFVADKGFIDPNACDNIALIARKGLIAPGEPVTADLLRGQTLNVVQGTWNEYFLDKELAPLGLNGSDLQRIDLVSTLDQQAMASGQLLVIVQNEPWVSRLVGDGNTPILQPAHTLLPGSESAVTMYGPKLIGPNAEVGTRFMVAYLQAVRAYNQGKTAHNLDILSQYNHLEKDVLQQMCWPALRDDGAINVDSLLDFQAWAVSRGLVPTPISKEQLWDPSFTTAANARLAAAAAPRAAS